MVHTLLPSLFAWLPEVVLSVGAMGVMWCGASARSRRAPTLLTGVVLCAAAVMLFNVQASPPAEGFFGMIRLDAMAHVFRWLALGVVALVVLMASSSSDVAPRWFGEYLGLLVVVGVGLMLMAEAQHLLMAYLSIELVSLTSYLLVALTRDARSSEAGLKYLLFGALSSGIMLFGMSLLFGVTGEMYFPAIRETLERLPPSQMRLCSTAVALVSVGLAFKISMVPFHMWTPDVYEGAPVPVTAMLSVGPKAAGLALLLRFIQALEPVWMVMAPVLVWLTVVTMTVGNLAALSQTNVKRLLAYSTIGQVGYLLIGISVNTVVGIKAILVYLAAYLFMNLGAFACVVAVVTDSGSESVDAFRGLARRAPVLALCCAVFLLSLAGLPPLFGFIGKFVLFGAAIQSGAVWLAVAAVVNSAVALYYYVNIIRQMYLLSPQEARPLRPAAALRVALGVCGMATVAFGVFPSGVLSWIQGVI
jgi:NADH-quinone oxidoreductase subunit N